VWFSEFFLIRFFSSRKKENFAPSVSLTTLSATKTMKKGKTNNFFTEESLSWGNLFKGKQ
jgi:hypothetical protein